MKVKIPEPTALDRVIGYFSPVAAARRQQARASLARMSVLAGGYNGASKGRRSLKSWITSDGDADDDILGDLPTLRERSRDLIRNSPLAAGAIHTKVLKVVGGGLRLQSSVDAESLGMTPEQGQELSRQIERNWRIFERECDISRHCSFGDLQDLAFRSCLENGDSFAALPVRDWGTFGLKVQLIEADRCSNPDWKSDSDRLRGGVEVDDDGAPVAYHFSAHPGGLVRGGSQAWQRVPAFGSDSGRRNVLHLFRRLRIGQSRGVPDLAPVIEPFKQLERYTEAELMAAVVAGMFTVFIESEADAQLDVWEPDDETGGKATDDDYRLANGGVVSMSPGEKISTANPGRPNDAFDPFVNAILRQIGVALELPYEVLIKHFSSSYSAARGALLEAWQFFKIRRQWLARNFCQPIFEAWLEEAVLSGRVSAPGFVGGDPLVRQAYCNCQWLGDSPGQIDELREAQAAEKRIEIGVSHKRRETSFLTGEDYEDVQRQRQREQQDTGATNEQRTDGAMR